MTRVKQGRLIPVDNKNKHQAANSKYYSVWVEDEDGGNERCILLTYKELVRAEVRAAKNPEDLTKKKLITDLLD